MKRLIYICLICSVLCSCSLFKLTVSTGDTPLSGSDLNIRMMTRGFYNEFTSEVVLAADSIIATSDKIDSKINAIRWKLGATSSCSAVAFQTIPEVSLLNTWALCIQMDHFLHNAPDSILFGAQTLIAQHTSSRLKAKAEYLANKVLSNEKFEKMNNFLTKYCDTHHITDMNFIQSDLLLEWVGQQGENEKAQARTVGAVSEVMADMSDRMSSSTRQFGNELSWTKDLISIKLQQDSLQNKLTIQLDSLNTDFRKMVLIFEHSPELLDAIAANFSTQITSLIGTMNYSLDNAFINIGRERAELQEFVNQQRQLLMQQSEQAVQTTIKNLVDSLPTLIGKVLFYIILFLIVLFSLPFAIGFLLGRAKERNKTKSSDR